MSFLGGCPAGDLPRLSDLLYRRFGERLPGHRGNSDRRPRCIEVERRRQIRENAREIAGCWKWDLEAVGWSLKCGEGEEFGTLLRACFYGKGKGARSAPLALLGQVFLLTRKNFDVRVEAARRPDGRTDAMSMCSSKIVRLKGIAMQTHLAG